MKNKISDMLFLNSSIESIEETPIDERRFIKVKVWIAHTGKNLNKSYFSRDVLEKMSESLPFTPIVGYIYKDEANEVDFKGHEEIYKITENGIETEYLGRMYGFIPKDCNSRFEFKTIDGVKREYLVADGIISRKFNNISDIFDKTTYKNQSMELLKEDFDGYYDNDNDQFIVTNASFDALCILGDKMTPAMVGGAFEKYSADFKSELMEYISKEYKDYIEYSQKGEKELKIDIKKLFEKYSYLTNEFKSEIEKDLNKYSSEDELEKLLKEENSKQYSLTVNAMFTLIGEQIEAETVTDDYGYVYSKRWIMDLNIEDKIVYYLDLEAYKYYGVPYTEENGKYSVDFEKSFRVVSQPVRVENDVEGATDYSSKGLDKVKEVFSAQKENELKTKETEFTGNIEKVKTEFNSKIETLETELKDLREYKAKIEEQEKLEYIEKVENLEDFEKETFKTNIANYSLSELEDEIAKVVGKKMLKFSAKVENEIKDDASKYNDNKEQGHKLDYLFKG